MIDRARKQEGTRSNPRYFTYQEFEQLITSMNYRKIPDLMSQKIYRRMFGDVDKNKSNKLSFGDTFQSFSR